MDEDLLVALAQKESNFNPQARGSSGEYGLFQIMPANVAKFSTPDEDPLNPEVNTRMAVDLFSEELNRYNGDEKLAVAAYNAGSPAVDRAIAKAGSRDYEDIAQYLPESTATDYVPGVFDIYNQRKSARLDQVAANQSQSNTSSDEWGTPDEFNTAVRDYATREGFDDLSPKEQVQGISRLYQSRKWMPQVDANLYKVTQPSGITPQKKTDRDISSIITPYLSLVEGESPEEISKAAEQAKKKMRRDLNAQGFNPNLVGSIIDETFDRKIQKENSDVRGIFGEIKTYGKEITKGGLELFTGAAAGAADFAGYEDAATTARTLGQTTLGENLDLYYELDDNGNVLLDENNEPVTKYRGNILRGAGNLFAAVGSLFAGAAVGTAAGLSAGAAATASALGLGGLNTLNSMGQAYELAKEETGDRDDAMQAALGAVPTSVLNTIADVYTVGAGKFWIQGLTGANKLRATAQLAARSAAMGAAGNAVEQTGIELSAQSATEGAYQASSANISGAALGGAAAGVTLGGLEGYRFRPAPKPRTQTTPDKTTAESNVLPVDGGERRQSGSGLSGDQKGSRKGLPIPERYQSGEPILLPPEVVAEQQIALAQRLEEFSNNPEKQLILDYDRPESIPQDLLNLFGYEAQQLSPKQVAIIKRETYVPPQVTDLPQIDTAIDSISNSLANAPDPTRHSELITERAELKKERRTDQG